MWAPSIARFLCSGWCFIPWWRDGEGTAAGRTPSSFPHGESSSWPLSLLRGLFAIFICTKCPRPGCWEEFSFSRGFRFTAPRPRDSTGRNSLDWLNWNRAIIAEAGYQRYSEAGAASDLPWPSLRSYGLDSGYRIDRFVLLADFCCSQRRNHDPAGGGRTGGAIWRQLP